MFKSVPNQISTHSVRSKNIEERGGIFHIGRNERQCFDLVALLPLKFSLPGDRFRERTLLKGFCFLYQSSLCFKYLRQLPLLLTD